MSRAKLRNALYAQSGGATAVINASACGVIEAARRANGRIGKLYAARNGILGALNEDLRAACLAALDCSRAACRDFALQMSWTECARLFITHVREGNTPQHRKRARRLKSVAA